MISTVLLPAKVYNQSCAFPQSEFGKHDTAHGFSLSSQRQNQKSPPGFQLALGSLFQLTGGQQ